MKTLVSGATSFIGANLVRKLLDKGEEVRVFIRPSSNSTAIDSLSVERAYGDVTNYESFREAIRGCSKFYHVAGSSDLSISQGEKHDLTYRINIEGTENAARAALKEGIEKMVYTSTSGTIGWGTRNNPANEDATYNFSYFHLAAVDTKHMAENKLQEFIVNDELPATIVNPSMPFGCWDTKPTSGKLIQYAKYGLLFLFSSGGTNIVDVEDVAIGHILAMEKGRIGQRYLLSGKNISYKELFSIINKNLNRPEPLIHVPFLPAFIFGAVGESINSVLPLEIPLSTNFIRYVYITHYINNEKAQKELGLKFKDPEKAVKKQIDWMKENRYI